MVVTVRLAKGLRLRIEAGLWLIRLASRVMGCRVEVRTEEGLEQASGD